MKISFKSIYDAGTLLFWLLQSEYNVHDSFWTPWPFLVVFFFFLNCWVKNSSPCCLFSFLFVYNITAMLKAIHPRAYIVFNVFSLSVASRFLVFICLFVYQCFSFVDFRCNAVYFSFRISCMIFVESVVYSLSEDVSESILLLLSLSCYSFALVERAYNHLVVTHVF